MPYRVCLLTSIDPWSYTRSQKAEKMYCSWSVYFDYYSFLLVRAKAKTEQRSTSTSSKYNVGEGMSCKSLAFLINCCAAISFNIHDTSFCFINVLSEDCAFRLKVKGNAIHWNWVTAGPRDGKSVWSCVLPGEICQLRVREIPSNMLCWCSVAPPLGLICFLAQSTPSCGCRCLTTIFAVSLRKARCN